MGWKTSGVLLRGDHLDRVPELFEALGMPGLSPCGEVAAEAAFSSEKPCAGTWNSNTVLFGIHPKTVSAVLERGKRERLGVLNAAISGSESFFFALQSANNFYAWRLSRSGESLRFRAGSAGGFFCEEGSPLPAERRLLEKYKFEKQAVPNGVKDLSRWRRFWKAYRSLLSREPKGPWLVEASGTRWSHDQLGEAFLFEILRDYLGERVDESEQWMTLPFTKYCWRKNNAEAAILSRATKSESKT
jgi:hypothetical protein